MQAEHSISNSPATPSGKTNRQIILVGNPNVGKSVLFSRLTHQFVIISNYPGTTVEVTRTAALIGQRTVEVIDTPGINELAPRTEDARVTCDILRDHPDALLVQVADAKNLRRALLITLQLQQLNRPLVLVLNMMDELNQCGGKINIRQLSSLLGVPVVPTVATASTGIHLLQKTIAENLEIPVPPAVTSLPSTTDTATIQDHLARVSHILSECYTISQPHHPTLAQQLGWWATHPIKGFVIVAIVLYIMFWFVGLLGAGVAVDFLETVVFGRYLNPAAIRVADALLPFPHAHNTEASEYALELPTTPAHGITILKHTCETTVASYTIEPSITLTGRQKVLRFIHDFLVGPYGIITMALSYALAIVLPIVTSFFLLFSILEDSGYLSRLAVMLNRVMRRMGLNGKAVLPMVLGLGCDTMATMTTRILETRKERIVTTLLLALAVPCSAQLGVILAMMANISWTAALFWVALMIAVAFTIGWLASRVLGGPSSDFILELPPMRRPQIENVVAKTFARLEWYLKEVIPLFIAGTAFLFLLDQLHLLDRMSAWTEPLVTGWLGLPAETASAFIVGFLRRDFGAVYLLDASTGLDPKLTPHQILVAMVTITLFMPCIATLFMIARELGRQTAFWITIFIFPFAFFIGGLVNHCGKWLGR